MKDFLHTLYNNKWFPMLCGVAIALFLALLFAPLFIRYGISIAPTAEPIVVTEFVYLTPEPTPKPPILPTADFPDPLYKTSSGLRYHVDGCKYLGYAHTQVDPSSSEFNYLIPCTLCFP